MNFEAIVKRLVSSLSKADHEALVILFNDPNKATNVFKDALQKYEAHVVEDADWVGLLTTRKCWTDPDPSCSACFGTGSITSFYDSYTSQTETRRCDCMKWIPKDSVPAEE